MILQDWQLQASGIHCGLTTVQFLDLKNGWAAGGVTQPYTHTSSGVLLRTKDGGVTWELQPTITTSSLFTVAYHGGDDAWVAGRGGAILRRMGDVATVKIPRPKLPPVLRQTPKLKPQPNGQETPIVLDDGDIPRAVPRQKQNSESRSQKPE